MSSYLMHGGIQRRRFRSAQIGGDDVDDIHPAVRAKLAEVAAETAGRRWGRSLHEAAHVVCSLAFMRSVFSVERIEDSVGHDDGRSGHFWHYEPKPKELPGEYTPPPRPVFDADDPWLVRNAAILFAGFLGELRAPIGSTDFATGCLGDLKNYRSMLSTIIPPFDEPALRRRATRLAYETIDKNWEIVEALARALEGRRILYEADIKAIVRATPGGYALLGETVAEAKQITCSQSNDDGERVFASGVAIGLVRPLGDGCFAAVVRGGREVGRFHSRGDAERAIRRASPLRWRCDGLMSA